ncbi:MAG: 4-hydroxybenzoate decarboxylase subunit C [Elusimicrobia bacterium]|nr:4-hydroxybenzoate decarboxylase subunit C [Elusimicrobiota bacterium]
MPFKNLQTFVSHLEKEKDLIRIKAEVDPVLEVTEIATRVVKKSGPALLFENIKGSRFPLLINVLGAARRVEWALGRSPAQVGQELSHLAESLMPPSPQKLWHNRSGLVRVLKMKPKFVARASLTMNKMEPANMDLLPLAQSWPKDGGKFITFPLVITQSPKDGKQNMGVYRMHVYGKNKTGMHWQIGKGGGYHYQEAEARDEKLPVVVIVGADPILMMCGILPLPEGLSEMSFAGFLRGTATAVTDLTRPKFPVPAEAEFALEGFVSPHQRRQEGPYGDHFGHYSLEAPFPVFQVERIWHRPQAIFPIAVVGKPPQEDQVIGDAVQEMLLPLLKIMHPEISDLWAYQEAGFHNLLVISVKQRFEKEAIKTALWALGEGQLALTKCVVVVDADVDARNFNAVLKSIRNFFDPKDDFLLLPGTSQDTLDFTSGKMNLGSKFIIDATAGPRKFNDRPPVSLDIQSIGQLDPRIKEARILEGTMLVLQVTSGGREVLEKMLTSPAFQGFSMVATVSEDVPLNDNTLLLWGLFTRFDCHRDTFFGKTALHRGHPVYSGPLFIDATWKPDYPEPLVMNQEIIERVNRRWPEYGIE